MTNPYAKYMLNAPKTVSLEAERWPSVLMPGTRLEVQGNNEEFVNEEHCCRVKHAVAVEGATRHQLTKFRYQIKYKVFMHTSL